MSTVPTKQEMLDNIDIAINNLMTGGAVQSYTINGRNLQRFSLTELQNLRKQIKGEIAAENADGTTTYATFERP